jgi:periplasmic divalent cation tolerance protein
MRTAARAVVVLVTTPSRRVAARLAKLAVSERLAACVQILPVIESHYRWNGRVESARETLVIFKTLPAAVDALEKLVVTNHPYETPQFVVIPASGGSVKYLDWIAASVELPGKSARRSSKVV